LSRRRRNPEGAEETRFQVRSFDSPLSPEAYASLPKHPVHLVLDNLRSAFNVGAIFRTADTARVERVLTCGYTAHPPHPRLEKTALGALSLVATEHFDTTLDALDDCRARGLPVWALETTSHSRTYTRLTFPRPVALVLGNEALGVGPEILAAADQLVQIPVFGYKNSLNVASACAVVVFEILRQWGELDGTAGAAGGRGT